MTGPIREVTEDGVIDADGRAPSGRRDRLRHGLHDDRVPRADGGAGRDGRRLAEDAWAHGAEAYLGIAVPGFPNMFLLYGPNTNHGTGSAVELLEAQAKYVVQAVGADRRRSGRAARGAREVHEAFVREMDERLADSVWVGCSNWYVTEEGRVTNNWPGSQTEYRRRTRTVALGDYVTTAQGAPTGSGIPPSGTDAPGSPAESAAP